MICHHKNKPIHNHIDPSCHIKPAKKYWFYLAFENSLCNDYISEKFWRTLQTETVPIVMGGGNYSRDAPKKVICSYVYLKEPRQGALLSYSM